MTEREALKLALEALKANYLLVNGTEKAGGLAWCIDGYYSDCFDIDPINEQTERAITTAEEILAQPEQEPDDLTIAYMSGVHDGKKLRTWVGLTPQERDEINEQVYGAVPHHVAFHAAVEAKLKEKNT